MEMKDGELPPQRLLCGTLMLRSKMKLNRDYVEKLYLWYQQEMNSGDRSRVLEVLATPLPFTSASHAEALLRFLDTNSTTT